MSDIRPYRLDVFLHPQATPAERGAVETLVKSWITDHQGDLRTLTATDKRKLAYPIRHQSQPLHLRAAFAAPSEQVRELADRLKLEGTVLRLRLWSGEPPTGKRVKDVPLKKPETGGKGPALKTAPAKEKAPLEKLEEKIEEILEEEVL